MNTTASTHNQCKILKIHTKNWILSTPPQLFPSEKRETTLGRIPFQTKTST